MPNDDAAPALVLHIPHASTRIPDDVRRSFIVDDAQLRLELLGKGEAILNGADLRGASDDLV